MTSSRSNKGDDRRRRRDDNGKAKSAKTGRATDADGSNWQLKSAADSGHVLQGNSGVKPGSKQTAKNPVNPAEQMNGQAVSVDDKRARDTGRGQTSTEVKKQRSTQRQSSVLIANHDDWMTSTSHVHKKQEFVAVHSNANVKFKNNRQRRCVLM